MYLCFVVVIVVIVPPCICFYCFNGDSSLLVGLGLVVQILYCFYHGYVILTKLLVLDGELLDRVSTAFDMTLAFAAF